MNNFFFWYALIGVVYVALQFLGSWIDGNSWIDPKLSFVRNAAVIVFMFVMGAFLWPSLLLVSFMRAVR